MRALPYLLAALSVLALTAGALPASAAQPPLCSPPATESRLSGAFPAPPVPILNQPSLQVILAGQSGAFEGHVVLQPISAPPPALSDGCQENSRFTVTGFTGTLELSGSVAALLFGSTPVIISTTAPTDASIQVHFGTEPSRPLLTFRSKTPVISPFGPVRLLQIVGGQVVHAR